MEKTLNFIKTKPSSLDKIVTSTIEEYIVRYCLHLFYSGQQKLQQILNNILQELHNFEKRFCKYIRYSISQEYGTKLNTQYLINAVNLLAELTDFASPAYTDLRQIVKRPSDAAPILKKGYQLADEFSSLKDTYILSFNYTALFDILLVDSPCSYNNVHGKLCNNYCEETCNASNVIFGIDDTLIQSKIENSELRLFSKTYRKMSDLVAPTKILPSNDISVTIKFYGHSLSQADYSYFQSIFDYYNIYGNNNVSLIFYYSEGYEQTDEDEIYKLINSYGKTLNNQEQGKNLMHKLLLENRLKIKKI